MALAWAYTMSTQRQRLWGLVVERSRGRPVTVANVCAVVIVAAGVDGVALTVATSAREALYASDHVVSEVEELTITLGEGPGVEALEGPVLVPDLDATDSRSRWPIYAAAVVEAGFRAVFALPLRVGGTYLGVMDLYRAEHGSLGREQLADALVLADTACAILLDGDGWNSRTTGSGPEPVAMHHPEVHQATGMLIVQMGVSAAVAMTRLRAYAYAHDRRLRDVAGDVVERRLRFYPEAEDREPA
jgi:hypothetical protein